MDFIIQREGKTIPIEVKSADNTKAKSLNVYMGTHKPGYAIKLSTKNFGFEDGKRRYRCMQCFVCKETTTNLHGFPYQTIQYHKDGYGSAP